MPLTKSTYLQYLACPEALWMVQNQSDAFEPLGADAQFRFEQGNLIDKLAQDWFMDGCVIEDQAIDPTQVEFQFKVQTKDFLAIAEPKWVTMLQLRP